MCYSLYVARDNYDCMTSRFCRSHLWAPAVHGFTEELTRADEHGEQYQESRRVLAVHSVDEVIVKAELEVTKVERDSEEAVHCGCDDDGTSTATTFRGSVDVLMTGSHRS